MVRRGLFARPVPTYVHAVARACGVTMRPSTPYVLTGLGLVAGLVVLLFDPLATAALNYLGGGASLAVAVASVAYRIVAHSGPNERRPEF